MIDIDAWQGRADAGDGQFAIACALLHVARAINDVGPDGFERLVKPLGAIASAFERPDG